MHELTVEADAAFLAFGLQRPRTYEVCALAAALPREEPGSLVSLVPPPLRRPLIAVLASTDEGGPAAGGQAAGGPAAVQGDGDQMSRQARSSGVAGGARGGVGEGGWAEHTGGQLTAAFGGMLAAMEQRLAARLDGIERRLARLEGALGKRQ